MKTTLDFRAGFWRLADPKISLASMASIFLGACAAGSQNRLNFLWLFLVVIGIFALEVAKNASGEVFDFLSGNDQAVAEKDRSPFSGGKRVLVDGLLTKDQTIAIAAICYLAGIIIGLYIVFFIQPAILWFGVIGVALAFFYHAPPFKLSYRGFGELAVAICYGPLISIGTYLVQNDDPPPALFASSAILGLLIANFLIINEFPDFHADRYADKNNLVARLGRGFAARIFVWIFGIALLSVILLSISGFFPNLAFGLIAFPAGYLAAKDLLLDHENVPNIIPAQGQTLLVFLLYAFGAGIGFLV